MKIDPDMYMKTKATLTNCPAKNTPFTSKSANCATTDNNQQDFLPNNSPILP